MKNLIKPNANSERLNTLAIVEFRMANKYIHADQYWFDFVSGHHWYVRSNSSNSFGDGLQKFTWPYFQDDHHCINADVWYSYLSGKHKGSQPVVPFFHVSLSKNCVFESEVISNEPDKYLFLNQVCVCPLCGNSWASEPKQSHNFSACESWQVIESQRDDLSDSLQLMRKRWTVQQSEDGWGYLKTLIDDQCLKTDHILHKRCSHCRTKKWSFRDVWKYRHAQVVRASFRLFGKDDYNEYCEAKKCIESIWPEDFAERPNYQKSILRNARKRARIKPLSRGEIAFFSMHLAGSQIRELKAINRTHDINKILNQAN